MCPRARFCAFAMFMAPSPGLGALARLCVPSLGLCAQSGFCDHSPGLEPKIQAVFRASSAQERCPGQGNTCSGGRAEELGCPGMDVK